MGYQFCSDLSTNEHDEFVSNHEYCNLLQTSSWAQIKDNWQQHIVGVKDGEKLVASALILRKPLPMHCCMMYIPRGPILDYGNRDLLAFFFKELKQMAKKYHCLFIKMDPGIHLNDYAISKQNINYHQETLKIIDTCKSLGLKHKGFTRNIKQSIQPRYQANVYKSDTFMDDLPRHTKRLIKDATKRDVQIIKADINRITEFSDVVALTEKRKQVNLRNHEYFKKLMEIYQEDAYLFLAQVNIDETLQRLKEQHQQNEKEISALGDGSPKKQRRLLDIKASLEKDIVEFEKYHKDVPISNVIAGILSIKCGNTMEMLYAGMDDTFKKFMPQYLLYTENMKYGFEHGCEFANMGGVEGDLQDGLSRFKANFNPTINEFIGEFDLPVNKLLYSLSAFAYEARKKKNN